MAHEIMPSPHPNIVCLRLYGDVAAEDMVLNTEIGLDKGEPIYVLVDASELSLALPANYLDTARNSFFINPNMAHLSVYTGSTMLDAIGNMIAKLTRRRDRLSLHKSRDEALNHLLKMVK
ncbi:MAG: hypothetical protein K8L97_15015 [Anaerolineae bacterium]|nr:hypothetical protein [Anaerolineae bacterium]